MTTPIWALTRISLAFTGALLLLAAGAGADDAPPPATKEAAVVKPEPDFDMNALAQIADVPGEAAVYANRGGFCLDLGCGDGKLAVEIAQKTHMFVFGLAGDEADCQTTRQAMDKANLFGTRAGAAAGSLSKLPFPNGYGNLIVTGDYRAALNLSEVVRVLNPNGVAVIGGGKTDAAKLKAALDAAGIKDYKLVANYAILHGKLPEGTDEWTHFTPRPDNIHVSRETTLRPPFRTQWILTDPDYDDKAVQHAAIANGRVVFRADVEKPSPDRYWGFDAFNGALLWQRPVAKAHNNYRYALIDDTFFSSESGTVVALDATSGRLKKEYRPADVTQTVFWLAVADGTLYTLGRTAQLPATTTTILGACNLFCAYDVKGGDLLWKHECPVSVLMQSVALDAVGGIDYTTIAQVEGEKAPKGGVGALDAKTGQERWHHDIGPLWARYNDCTAAGVYHGKYFVWCSVDAKGVQGTKSFDPKTGEQIMDYPGVRSWGEGLCVQLLFVDDKIYCNTTAGHEPYRRYDIATGVKEKNVNQEPARDHPGSATANTLFCGGEGFCVYDLLTGKPWQDPFIRYSDFAEPYLAEGMFFHMPTVCHCPHAFGGPMALAPAGADWTPPAADEDMAARLMSGSAAAVPLADATDEQWTHYHGNAGHTGEAATAPQTPLKVGWEQKLGGTLTAPSFGQGLAFTASRNGSVWGLDQASGEIRWRFLCGGGVRVTPAYGRGRVLVGSDDGWIYCLEAKTGRVAWRFRAAPQERYINMEGQLVSQWPSVAGVVMDDKIAYCAAGLQAFDGTYLYALDIQSGKPLWAKRIGDLEQRGAPQGIMALADDKLIVPCFTGRGTLAYRKADGELIPWYAKGRPFWIFGSEAVADGDLFFYGGGRIDNPDHYARPFAFTAMDSKTGWLYGPIGSKPTTLAPIWVAPVLGKNTVAGDGYGFDRAKFCATMQEDPSSVKGARDWSVSFWPDVTGKPAREKTAREKAVEKHTVALALAGDVILAAGNSEEGKSEVVAFEAKVDGKEFSRVAVPDKILQNSLSVCGGRVFVVSEGGSVYCLGGKDR